MLPEHARLVLSSCTHHCTSFVFVFISFLVGWMDGCGVSYILCTHSLSFVSVYLATTVAPPPGMVVVRSAVVVLVLVLYGYWYCFFLDRVTLSRRRSYVFINGYMESLPIRSVLDSGSGSGVALPWYSSQCGIMKQKYYFYMLDPGHWT
jgi:hypothetical protein